MREDTSIFRNRALALEKFATVSNKPGAYIGLPDEVLDDLLFVATKDTSAHRDDQSMIKNKALGIFAMSIAHCFAGNCRYLRNPKDHSSDEAKKALNEIDRLVEYMESKGIAALEKVIKSPLKRQVDKVFAIRALGWISQLIPEEITREDIVAPEPKIRKISERALAILNGYKDKSKVRITCASSIQLIEKGVKKHSALQRLALVQMRESYLRLKAQLYWEIWRLSYSDVEEP